MDKYELLLYKSKEIWEESISGGGYVKKKEDLIKDSKSTISSMTTSTNVGNKPLSS
jgi:hypothetical protein